MQKNLFIDGLTLRFIVRQDAPSEQRFIDDLVNATGFQSSEIRGGQNGYPMHVVLSLGVEVMIVKFGSTRFGMTVCVEAKSIASQMLADFASGYYRVAWVCTRVDVAVDMNVDYLETHGVLKEIAMKKNLDTDHRGDWDRGVKGRTYYVGSTTSDSRFRLYEKSEEQWYRAKNKDYPANIVRLEWQFRPNRKKGLIETLDPKYILSLNKSAVDIFNKVCATAIVQTRYEPLEKSTELESFYHMMHQYKNIIKSLSAEKGTRWLIRQADIILNT